MAQNLQQLKRRIKTAQNISQIAKAMEMISASKIKRAQDTVEHHTPYAERITALTQTIMKNTKAEELNHSYVTGNDAKRKLLIVLSPDKGLCGSLNTNLLRKVFETDDPSLDIITIGRKAELYSSRLKGNLVASFPMGTSLPNFGKVYELTKIINEYYLGGKVSGVELLFTKFNSIFSQTPVIESLLPLPSLETDKKDSEYIFEPEGSILLDELLPYYLEIKLFNVFLQAYTSEQAARMVAMQNAKNAARDIADYLTLAYNKSRQEKITNEILDLANSAY
jgi:F-type H+-transporting ATPase subunit gamma